MRVLVTGGSGSLGQIVVRDLLAQGWEVVSADRVRADEEEMGVRYVRLDLCDVGQVAGAMQGCRAVVHLGAIPAPYSQPDEVVFGNNTRATFAVLQAASMLGIARVAIASSLSALGTAWSPAPLEPRYAPVDEAHPLLVADPYGLSKEVDERTAEMFHRRTGMSVVALRFAWIIDAEQAAQAAERLRDNPGPQDQVRVLWAYVDVWDAAAACRRALEADGPGFTVCNITAADTLSEIPTEDLIRRYAPQVEIRRPIAGTASAFSLDKARRVLGYEPEHTWRS